MGLLDKLFKKTKNNNILEDNQKYDNQNNDFNESLKYTAIPPELNPNLLEYDIQIWLNKFFNNPYQYYALSDKAYASLTSTTRPPASVEDRNINTQNETYLNQYIDNINSRQSFQYGRLSTNTPSGQKAFNFIYTEQGKLMDTQYRLYVNCEHKHTSRMVYEILKQSNPQENLQLKYVSSEYPRERNEKIVIYSSNENEFNTMFNRLQNIHNNNPELYRNNQNLPFMKNYLPGIGYGNSPKQTYIDLNNNPKPNLEKSFNSYLAEELLESIVDTTNRICAIDPEVNAKFYEYGFSNEAYVYMDNKYHKSIMQNMVDKVLLLSEKNSLDIKTNHMQNLPRYNNKKEKDYNQYFSDSDINI